MTARPGHTDDAYVQAKDAAMLALRHLCACAENRMQPPTVCFKCACTAAELRILARRLVDAAEWNTPSRKVKQVAKDVSNRLREIAEAR